MGGRTSYKQIYVLEKVHHELRRLAFNNDITQRDLIHGIITEWLNDEEQMKKTINRIKEQRR